MNSHHTQHVSLIANLSLLVNSIFKKIRKRQDDRLPKLVFKNDFIPGVGWESMGLRCGGILSLFQVHTLFGVLNKRRPLPLAACMCTHARTCVWCCHLSYPPHLLFCQHRTAAPVPSTSRLGESSGSVKYGFKQQAVTC